MAFVASPRRLAAALASAVYLAALFAGPLHLLLVEHVRCAEHGQLVHASEHAREQAPEAAHDVLLAGDRHADHDHCASCAVAPEPVLAAAPATSTHLLRAGDADGSEPTIALAQVPASRRYLIAPKQSPPV